MRAAAPHRAGALGVLTSIAVCLAALPQLHQPDPTLDLARAGTSSAVITVTDLEPRTVIPGSTITVTGTVTNTTDVPLLDLVLRLQRGPVLTTRDALRDNDVDPSAAASASAPFVPLATDLPVGSNVAFTYRTTAEALGLSELGVYPLLVNVNATPDGDVEQRVGELDTYLPYFPAPPAEPTSVAWLWPLVDRPHRGPDGGFLDDELTDSVAVGGRLERLVQVAEADPRVGLTLAVDPMLLTELRQMVAGYTLPDGSPGRGGPQAAAWLGRLSALAARHPVLALPWADADVVALVRAGLARRAADAVARGREVVANALSVTPEQTLAWPVDGALTPGALTVWRDAGADRFVLDSTSTGGDATTVTTPGASARLIDVDGGQVAALVTDPVLQSIVTGADRWPDGPRMAEQRWLAELSMITAESPGRGRGVLVAPPRRWEARASYALPMLTDAITQQGLAAADTDDLATATPLDRGTLSYPEGAAAAEVDPAGMARLREASDLLEDFAAMLVDTGEADRTAADLVEPLDAAVISAASAAFRGDPAAVRVQSGLVAAAVQAQRARVTLIVPADGVYSLASARASLVFTVANDLPVPVRVRIGVDASLVAGLSLDDSVVQVIQPGRRALVEVPAEVERPGEFRVTAVLSSPAGVGLGTPVRLTVRSTVYGGLSLAITAAAGGLLVVLFALRLLRWLRRRRRAPAPGLSAGRVPAGAAR